MMFSGQPPIQSGEAAKKAHFACALLYSSGVVSM